MEYSNRLDLWVHEDVEQSDIVAALAAHKATLIAKGFAKEWINYFGQCNQDLINFLKSLDAYGTLIFVNEYPPSIKADFENEDQESFSN